MLAAAYPGGAPKEERPELRGFLGAFKAHGARPDHDLVRFAHVSEGAEEATSDLMRGLLAGGVGTGTPGLVVFSYTLAPGAARAVSRSGVRVPDELALVMGDEDAEARETLDAPPTTVQSPKFEMAQAAARLLLRLVRREEVSAADRRQRFPMELRVRWTCGVRRGSASAGHR
jgi:DNA-binding LacI/PurR family transcriptional regulator